MHNEGRTASVALEDPFSLVLKLLDPQIWFIHLLTEKSWANYFETLPLSLPVIG